MLKIALLSALCAMPLKPIDIASGVEDEDLADTPETDVINMNAGQPTNQLSLTLSVTAGTSTRVQVVCYESNESASDFGPVPLCDSATPAACKPDLREFTLSDYTAVSGVIHIASRWPIVKQFAQCTADDPDDGTGTVTITGARSWQ